MSAPKQTCQLCGNSVEVKIEMKGFPPDTARAKLKRLCKSQGCEYKPKYTAGFDEKGFRES